MTSGGGWAEVTPQHALSLLMGRNRLEFMASAATAPDPASIDVVKPAGVQVGDLVFVWVLDTTNIAALTTSSGSAWSFQRVAMNSGATNGFATLYWKVLNAIDVANNWNHAGGSNHGMQAVRYRANGANAAAAKSTQSNTGVETTMTLAGFARAGGHYAAIAFFGVGSSSGAGSIVAPTGFAERRRDSGAGVAGSFAGIVADRLDGYQDGTAVVFTGGPDTPDEYGILVEVTGP